MGLIGAHWAVIGACRKGGSVALAPALASLPSPPSPFPPITNAKRRQSSQRPPIHSKAPIRHYPLPQSSVLVIRPSTSLRCADCGEEQAAKEGGATVLLVPAGLRDQQLLSLLEPYSKYRVWRLSFGGVETPAQAFGGFACRGEFGLLHRPCASAMPGSTLPAEAASAPALACPSTQRATAR